MAMGIHTATQSCMSHSNALVACLLRETLGSTTKFTSERSSRRKDDLATLAVSISEITLKSTLGHLKDLNFFQICNCSYPV